jgi:hypothetical protein
LAASGAGGCSLFFLSQSLKSSMIPPPPPLILVAVSLDSRAFLEFDVARHRRYWQISPRSSSDEKNMVGCAPTGAELLRMVGRGWFLNFFPLWFTVFVWSFWISVSGHFLAVQ